MNRMPVSPLVMKALEVAERRLGMAELSRQLGAHESTIRTWGMGHATMPDRKWFKLIDIITGLDPSWVDWDENKPPK